MGFRADSLLTEYPQSAGSPRGVRKASSRRPAAGAEQQRVRLLFGPGIPAAILGDQMDGHEVDLSNETLAAFIEQSNGQDG